jgi:hypothetical protein
VGHLVSAIRVPLQPRDMAGERIHQPAFTNEDQWIALTVSIPLIPTIAFFWDRLGVEKDAAMRVLRDAITEAMRLQTNESPAIKSKMDDVAEPLYAVA